MNVPQIPLPTGATIPQLGLGTYKLADGIDRVVKAGLEQGYRHLDTAQMYGNEADIGRALAASPVPREDLFITSKLDNPNHLRPEAEASFAQTLRDLRTDYVDLFLIHWPLPTLYGGDFVSTWAILEEFLAQGRARAIGVSNFEPEHLRQLIEAGRTVPHVNQVESHPYLPNEAVHAFDADHGIVTEAWSPLARGRASADPLLAEIGRPYGKTASQVALRWALQRGDVVFPKASSAGRLEENAAIFDFSLSAEDLARIATLDQGEAGRTGGHPSSRI